MSKLFYSHKRFIGLGLVTALVIALAALGTLWGLSQGASAQGDVTLVHVQPDGSDYAGNDYCPDTVWVDGVPTPNPAHDCNNIVGQDHLIRTDGAAGLGPWGPGFEIDGVGVIVNTDVCSLMGEAQGRPNWDPANDLEWCVVIRSIVPGETSVQFTYLDAAALSQTTTAIIKEWDSLADTVILKAEPADEDGDTIIDAVDHHLADQQGTWESDPVVWDEAVKRIRSYPPVQLIEIVHGEHDMLIDNVTVTVHQPTQGAIILAQIEGASCTYFTDPLGVQDFGQAMNGVSDLEGRFVGPQAAPDITMPGGLQLPQIDDDADTLFGEDPIDGSDNDGDTLTDEDPSESHTGASLQGDWGLRDIYVDTTCEEQAVIVITVGYPDSPGSLKVPVDEWIGINWTTVEAAKQPQIRWAGEEIILAKRWALPDEYDPNADCGAEENELCPPCPLASSFDIDGDGDVDGGDAIAQGHLVDTDGDGLMDTILDYSVVYQRLANSPGALKGAYSDNDGDGYLDDLDGGGGGGGWGDIDRECVSKGLYDNEDQGEVDVEVSLMEHQNVCFPELGDVDGDTYPDAPDAQWMPMGINGSVWLECYDPLGNGEAGGYGDSDYYDVLINKHAFLVWYLKIYQAKLDNIPLDEGDGRADHNAGDWEGEDPIESEGADVEVLNVSQDALLRVTVKGWFEAGNNCGNGAVCVDMDGDNGGLPYPLEQYEQGCADPDDEILDHGHCVLPDDLEDLAGAYAGLTRQSWDVMSDIDDDPENDEAIGPKSSLDSHDSIVRPWVPGNRKTIDPDLEVTVADAIMPPLKIRALIDDPDDAGFLKEALKTEPEADDNGDDVASLGLDNLYAAIMIPADPEIPPIVNNGGYDWDSWGNMGPYEFYRVFNQDAGVYPRYIEFYTDNRGLGYFYANGDNNLSFDTCGVDPISGAPDCSPGDVVGFSVIEVIADYPYFRKHPAVLSNPVLKIWEWGGFKDVYAVPLDANHTRIVAELVDRDGYCKYDVDVDDDTGEITVVTSPSENPVQGEEIEFILLTADADLVAVSESGVYSPPAPHFPLQEATLIGYQDGVMIDRGEAVALAEDARVLAEDEDAPAVCTAWVDVEHSIGADLELSVYLHDPEGTIVRHWPPSLLTIGLVPGWNDSCYVDDGGPIEGAIGSILCAEGEPLIVCAEGLDLYVTEEDEEWACDDPATDEAETGAPSWVCGDEAASPQLLAVYRYDADDGDDAWKAFFPQNLEVSDLLEVNSYDQLFILMDASADWIQEISALPASVLLAGASGDDDVVAAWNSVCYAGADKATEEATLDIETDFAIMYTLGADQMWRRYVPGRPDIPDTLTTLHTFDSVILLVTTEGGATWVFDP
jgi:hypothetical protein